ncbi:UDP-glucose 4-epimerase GalE [Paenibacillus thermotolerans]|uniref:UDP-glucose 4-epimerase GalE n=1 Tax=Paenibacillus thermotolerans TaxID=3027807 RepID=UPI002368E006|nr:MULTISPECIES: UDP-glucose 4-epimerase GalE [unclassified Paenibacillus]
MAVLVTGGAGYIGSHACAELLEAGYEIVAIDNFANSGPESFERVSRIANRQFAWHKVDLLDREALEGVFAKHRIDAVMHFAGYKAVGESVRMPLSYYYNNITGTLMLCEAMNKYGVHTMVFSSSATVYGAAQRMPISEDFPLNAVNPYGQTKLMLERILQDAAASDPRWGISILRYFNPVGAHKSGLLGENPKGVPNNLMPFISMVAAGKLDKLRIFGSDYPTKDGTGIRDYIHVTDLAQGHLKALESIMERSGVDIYNLGTGKGYSVLEMVGAFERVSGRTVPYIIEERRPGDIAVCYADVAKACNELGWTAKRGIEEMCEDEWRWRSAESRRS